MLKKLWKDPKYLKETGKKKCPVWKLKDLKVITKFQQQDQKKNKTARLYSLEHEISYKIQNMDEGLSNSMMDVPLKDMDNERNTLNKQMSIGTNVVEQSRSRAVT